MEKAGLSEHVVKLEGWYGNEFRSCIGIADRRFEIEAKMSLPFCVHPLKIRFEVMIVAMIVDDVMMMGCPGKRVIRCCPRHDVGSHHMTATAGRLVTWSTVRAIL